MKRQRCRVSLWSRAAAAVCPSRDRLLLLLHFHLLDAVDNNNDDDDNNNDDDNGSTLLPDGGALRKSGMILTEPPPLPPTTFAPKSLQILARRQTHLPVLVLATEAANKIAWKNQLRLVDLLQGLVQATSTNTTALPPFRSLSLYRA